MIPDAETLLHDYLTSDSDVAAIVGDRVVGKTPSSTTDPWVRVTELDGGDGGHPDHLIPFLIQLDCYAGSDGGQAEAKLLYRTVRFALKQMHRLSHSGAVVSDVVINSAPRIPDADFEPARERVAMTVTLSAHAV